MKNFMFLSISLFFLVLTFILLSVAFGFITFRYDVPL